MSIVFEQVPEYGEDGAYIEADKGILKKEQLLEEIESAKKELSVCEKYMDAIHDAAERADMPSLYEKCYLASKKITKTAGRVGIIPAEYGIRDKKEYINRALVEKKDIMVTQTSEELHIILPELLPHRPQYDSASGQMRYLYDVDKWRADYYSALSAEFLRGKYRLMEEKACMIFLNHVKGSLSPDIDNFEYKIITDILTLFILVDDSNRYLSQFMDVVEDDKNYTEIIVCPQRRMGNYLDIG